MSRNDYVAQNGTLNLDTVFNNIDSNTVKINGIHWFSSPTDPSLKNVVNNNDMWINNTVGNEIMSIRINGVWTPMGAVYK